MYGFRAKLATMGAGKTEDLIREYYTHKRKIERTGATIITVKPAKDTRNVGISSRNGLSLTADVVVLPNQNLEDLLLQIEFDKELIILVDEVQFLEVGQVDQLFDFYIGKIKQGKVVKITCWGIKSNYMCRPFESSERLMGYAEDITLFNDWECNRCSKPAQTHLLKIDGNYISEGDPVVVGDQEYESVCYACYAKQMSM